MELGRSGPESVGAGAREPGPAGAGSKYRAGNGLGRGSKVAVIVAILLGLLGFLVAGIVYAENVRGDSSGATPDLPPSPTGAALAEFHPAEFCDQPTARDDALLYSPDQTNPIRVAQGSNEQSSVDYPSAWWESTPVLVACVRYGEDEFVQDCGTYTEVIGYNSLPISRDVEVTLYRKPLNVRLYEVRTAEILDETTLRIDPVCPRRVRAGEGASSTSVTERTPSRTLYRYLEPYVYAGR